MELLSAFFLLYFLDRFHLTRAALSILLAATKSKNKWAWGAPWRSEGRQARHSLTLQHAGINIFDPARIDDAMTQVELEWRSDKLSSIERCIVRVLVSKQM